MKIPKVLCHADGELFCVWHPDRSKEVYALYVSEEDQPPAPATLDIEGCVTDPLRLIWLPASMVVAVPVKRVVEESEPRVALGPYEAYDDEGGEA